MNVFNQDQLRNLSKNKFDLSHERKLSCKWGDLVPIYLQEVLPGDSFRVDTEIMVRMAPMLAPVMHRVDVYTHWFYVPNRIVWDNWEAFIKAEDQTSPVVHPSVQWTDAFKANFAKGTLADYFGIPTPATPATVVQPSNFNSLPFKGYQLIYNEYYRDQDLQTEIDIRKSVDGVDNSSNLMQLRKRAWAKDYFTSARPRAQKGEPVAFGNYSEDWLLSADGTVLPSGSNLQTINPGVDTADVQTASGKQVLPNILISDLRRAEAVQKYLERLQRSGNRYKEYLASNWGVISSDARIDRPEYLGGGKTPIAISETLQTSADGATGTTTPQGNPAGHGIGVAIEHGFKESFEEHGFVFGIMSIVPKRAYQNGKDRMWNRFNKFDYYTPDLALIGEQDVLNKEIWFDEVNQASTSQNSTFGYQQRYAEYKYKCDSVHGDMRDDLNFWHLGTEFTSQPNLNSDFISVKPEASYDNLNRIFAVTSGPDPFWIQLYHKVDAIRPILYESVPQLG